MLKRYLNYQAIDCTSDCDSLLPTGKINHSRLAIGGNRVFRVEKPLAAKVLFQKSIFFFAFYPLEKFLINNRGYSKWNLLGNNFFQA